MNIKYIEAFNRLNTRNEQDMDAYENDLHALCEAYAGEATAQYFLGRYRAAVSAKAEAIHQKQLRDTLKDIKNHSAKNNIERFQRFMEKGYAALIKGHRISDNRWEQDVSALLNILINEEKLPREMRSRLRWEEELNDRLLDAVSVALNECCEQKARSFDIKALKDAVRNDHGLSLALQKAQLSRKFNANYMRQEVLDHIPDDYADLYPNARTIDRHFILHIGPTNSGKTYAALQAMHEAMDGIYLAPLRLLAYEQFDSMNHNGIFCSLKTGEETISVPCATAQSCTIEMMDEHHHYDIAVIDEAQMVQDPMRGGHWTKAILGIWADEIHVCLAPEAEGIVVSMIEQCRDTYEIIRHERFTRLLPDKVSHVHFPTRVMPGDAYIVFSRSSAHACAAQLQKHGIHPSIIYGALPYDVRQNEARRFRDGETSVVVATDAIGMGLNLPIRRVVFLETEKFDGMRRRGLTATEYKQIAGRAGRYGKYEEGFFVSPGQMERAVEAVSGTIPPIRAAHLLFPDTLLGVNGPLSTIMRMWNNAPTHPGYRKGDLTQEIYLAEMLQPYSQDKNTIFSLVSMPFDAQRAPVMAVWQALASDVLKKKHIRLEPYIPDIDSLRMHAGMEWLENSYRIYDLLWYFAVRFDKPLMQRITDERKQVSAILMRILAESKLPTKVCKKCHKPIPWNSPYAICRNCAFQERGFPAR